MKKIRMLFMLILVTILFGSKSMARAEEVQDAYYDSTFPVPVVEIQKEPIYYRLDGEVFYSEDSYTVLWSVSGSFNWVDYDDFYYEVYRKTSSQPYTLYKVTDDTEIYESEITPEIYTYKVRVVGVRKSDSTKIHGADSNEATFAYEIKQTTIASAISHNGKGAKITVNQADGVDGYEILCASSINGTYVKKKDYTLDDEYVTIGKQTLGSTYYYKVRAYREINGVRYYSKASEAVAVTVVFKAPKVKKITVKTVTKAQLTWEPVEGVKGYYIYQSENGKAFKQIKKVKGAKKSKLTIKKLTNGVYYSYKIVAYGKINGKTTMGSESKEKGRYMDKLGYKNESYESRYRRVYGKSGKRSYKSDSKARKHMKTITIKAWDISASGKKYTRKYSLTVNKYLADTYKQIFKEIYQGKTKFPIHSIGCYNFRPGEHSTGTAVDVNPDENYMIDGKKIMAGSFWKPKSNPYSIGRKSEFAKIMKKYGFTQGIWGSRRDYMHFSYFGT